jgi:hypothetical protein
MEKEFVPYELALRLKELRFKGRTLTYYENGKPKLHNAIEGWDFNSSFLTCISRPTYSQAFKWFRDKHKLVFNFISYSIVKPGEYHWSITWNDEAKATGIVKTYEEAELACLEKLIEIVENS